MDPFRDDLAAAHARITDLEREVRSLSAKAGTKEDWRLRALVAIGITCFAAIAVLAFTEGSESRRLDRSFRGIAIAPPEKTAEEAPKGLPARAGTPKDSPANQRCSCLAGDPLCTCL